MSTSHKLHKLTTISMTLLLTVATLCSCGSKSTNTLKIEGDTITTQAQLLTLIKCDGYTYAEIQNPWDSTKVLARYALVDKSIPTPENIPEGVKTVCIPVEKTIVYSSVHAGAIDELGSIDAIAGVADAGYYKLASVTDRLKSGKITDIGSSMSPNAELTASLMPDALLVSPFENAGHGIIERLDAPLIEMADYMEATPLGRAEWIKLIGLLYGNYEKADTIYNNVCREYADMKQKADTISVRPKVISEQITDGVWYVPGGRSYMAQLFADAGASYPWSDNASTGSLQLDISTVLDKAHDADIWLIRTFSSGLTLDALRRNNPINAEFKAFKDGQVYNCDTSQSMLFEEFPFHPELLLKEFMLIFHPELFAEGTEPRYYKKIK